MCFVSHAAATTEFYALSLHDALPIFIQFARYIPMLVETGAKVIVEVPVAVRSLVESMPGVMRVVPKGLKLPDLDRKSTRLNSSHVEISYAVFCLKKRRYSKSHSYTHR